MPFLLSLTAISHILYCCASAGSYERSGGPRTGWRPHSSAKSYSGTPITTNELVPVQWTAHTGLHLRSINPCGFDSPRPTILQRKQQAFIFLTSWVLQLCMVYKERKAAEWENPLFHSLESWTTPKDWLPESTQQQISPQEQNHIKETNSSSTAFLWLCLSTSKPWCQQALAPVEAHDILSCWKAGRGCLSLAHQAHLSPSSHCPLSHDQPPDLNNYAE